MQGRVLVIEDEKDLAELIKLYLSKEGISVTCASSAEEARIALSREAFDLITLDINLPGMDGFDFLQEIRRVYDIQVMILSAREADEDIIMGLGIGADEYVVKPVAPRVLTARVRAMLRRTRIESESTSVALNTPPDTPPLGQSSTSPSSQPLYFGPYSIDFAGYIVTKNGDRIALSPKEFELLAFLIRNPGKTFSTDELYTEVWGNKYGDLTAIGVYIQRIRKKLEDDPQNPHWIETIRGRGYRFNPEGGIHEGTAAE